MKKTIDQIINNENYKSLNRSLEDRSVEIAEIIRKAMYEIQVYEIGDYKICKAATRSGFSKEYLGMLNDEGWRFNSLEDIGSYYYAGDFNAWIQAATTKQRIQFLNAARSIFDEIDRIKNSRCEQIEAALANTSDIK